MTRPAAADTAQVQVQNQLQAAMATLPQAVQQNGLTITKSSGSIFEVLSFTSEDGSMDNFDVANFMEARIDDQISRVSGVGNIQPIGQEYAMRIWLDPRRCGARHITRRVRCLPSTRHPAVAGAVRSAHVVPPSARPATIHGSAR